MDHSPISGTPTVNSRRLPKSYDWTIVPTRLHVSRGDGRHLRGRRFRTDRRGCPGDDGSGPVTPSEEPSSKMALTASQLLKS
jgi:hypothetical protein